MFVNWASSFFSEKKLTSTSRLATLEPPPQTEISKDEVPTVRFLNGENRIDIGNLTESFQPFLPETADKTLNPEINEEDFQVISAPASVKQPGKSLNRYASSNNVSLMASDRSSHTLTELERSRKRIHNTDLNIIYLEQYLSKSHVKETMAQIEVLNNLFYRILAPGTTTCSHLLHDHNEDKSNSPQIVIKRIPGFQSIRDLEQKPEKLSGILNGNPRQCARILMTSFLLQEDDLHVGNWGWSEKKQKLVRIDFDMAFYPFISREAKYGPNQDRESRKYGLGLVVSVFEPVLNADVLERFPLLSAPNLPGYWPTESSHILKNGYSPETAKLIRNLELNSDFIREKWLVCLAFLFIFDSDLSRALVGLETNPDNLLSCEGQTYTFGAAYAYFIAQKQKELRAALIDSTLFYNYLQTQEEGSLLRDLQNRLERFNQKITRKLDQDKTKYKPLHEALVNRWNNLESAFETLKNTCLNKHAISEDSFSILSSTP